MKAKFNGSSLPQHDRGKARAQRLHHGVYQAVIDKRRQHHEHNLLSFVFHGLDNLPNLYQHFINKTT